MEGAGSQRKEVESAMAQNGNTSDNPTAQGMTSFNSPKQHLVCEERGEGLIEVPIMGPMEEGFQPMLMERTSVQRDYMGERRKPVSYGRPDNPSPARIHAYPSSNSPTELSRKRKPMRDTLSSSDAMDPYREIRRSDSAKVWNSPLMARRWYCWWLFNSLAECNETLSLKLPWEFAHSKTYYG